MSNAEPRWADVERHCHEELQRLHNSLEALQPEATTNQLRGEIRAVRRVLALGQPQAPEPPERTIQPADTDPFV